MQLFRLTVVTSFNSLTIRTELDFKSEYLFRMCSVVTNLVTSLEFQPIRCGTTPFHFGRTRNVYVVATERSGQSGAWASRNVERARKNPSFVPNSGLIDAACNMKLFSKINSNFSYFKMFLHFILALYGNFFELCLRFYLLCRRGNNHFDVHF